MTITLDEHQHWANGIGKLLLAFAGIEAATLELIQLISLSKIHDSATRLQLHQRVELLLEICEGLDTPDHQPLIAVLEKVKGLQSTRNLVAHNPLVIEISVHPENVFLAKEVIRSRQNRNKRITLEELQDAAKYAEVLERQLFQQVEAARTLRGTAT
ncbi:hypothetical protein [Thermomonas haemolytica]|uniref:hypothetical protein n=1 Tax=Thermomonas haemolytica TaxID=141949 RepID=UPI001048340E|nr:hypothetical protein [Thermomonas haemolytica]